MLMIPAIDMKDGRCVRLRQGKMEDETVFGDDPVEVARRWVEAGARRLHMVDLNGAFEGRPVNAAAIRAVADQDVREGIPVLVVDPVMVAASGVRLLQADDAGHLDFRPASPLSIHPEDISLDTQGPVQTGKQGTCRQ